MQLGEIKRLYAEADEGVDVWLRGLKHELPGDGDELASEGKVRICEATRMLVAFVRHLWITSSILSERDPDAVAPGYSLTKLHEAENLMRAALRSVRDTSIQGRIQRRLDLLQELKELLVPARGRSRGVRCSGEVLI